MSLLLALFLPLPRPQAEEIIIYYDEQGNEIREGDQEDSDAVLILEDPADLIVYYDQEGNPLPPEGEAASAPAPSPVPEPSSSQSPSADPSPEPLASAPLPGEESENSALHFLLQRYHDRLFAIGEEAPLPEGRAYTVTETAVRETGQVLPAGYELTVLGREGDYARTNLGTVFAGALAENWEGDWCDGLRADSGASARYLGTVYSYGLEIPASLRQVLTYYTVELKDYFLDWEALGEEELVPASEYEDGVLSGSVMGLLSVGPAEGMRIRVCAIPEKMKWIFFHEFGHALDLFYEVNMGSYLSEEEGFQTLLEIEGEAFDRSIPFQGEHPDPAEFLAEMVAAYHCEGERLRACCPEMYAFLSSLEEAPVYNWTSPLPEAGGIIIYS